MEKSKKLTCHKEECQKETLKFIKYGYRKDLKKVSCEEHKLEGMILLKKRYCQYNDECLSDPTFGYEGEKKRRFCAKHKGNCISMRKDVYCKVEVCRLVASFGKEGKRMYCSSHKEQDSVRTVGSICLELDCGIDASYGNVGSTKRLYCSTHKKQGMVNVKRVCEGEGCLLDPCFGFEEENKRRTCSKHKHKGMINLRADFCIEEECNTLANFNYPGEIKKIYCYKHKKKGMYYLFIKRCEIQDCMVQASFGYKEEGIKKYCEKHKDKGMVNLFSKKCNSCKEYFMSIKKKEDFLCSICNPSAREKQKELKVKKLLEEKNVNFLYNPRYIHTDFGKIFYPDFLIENELNVVILEVDEYAHKDKRKYKPEDENLRMELISQVISDKYKKPVKFIRYNPHDKVCKKTSIEERNTLLIDSIKDCEDEINDLEPLYLMY